MSIGKIIGWFFLSGVILLLIVLFSGVCNTGAKMIDNANKVAYQEFSPEALLKKYEWFKDAASQLDAKLANLNDYKARYVNMKISYGHDSSNRPNWSRGDKEQWNIWQNEESGVKASYNDLAAEYNAAMSKFNYRFCNRGDLPQGATIVLPREYRPYI